MKIKAIFILSVVLLISCDKFHKKTPKKIVATVNNHILYKAELKEILPDNLDKEDSIIFVKSYIDEWALDKILVDKAKYNLPQKEMTRYNKMVKRYESELYKKAYMDAILKNSSDSIIDSLSIIKYYNNNKEIFKINEHLIQLRYLYIKNNLINFKKIKEKFVRFEKKDKKYLTEERLKFDKSNLNDSIWVKSLDIFKNLNTLTQKQQKKLLQKNYYFEVKDSLRTYFIYVKNVLKPNSNAPLSYIKPTIEQILENKKKLELKQKLEKDILKDAIKNNDYVLYP